LEKTNKAKTLKLRRLRKVGTSQRVDTSNDALMEDVSNQGRVIDRDEDAVKETEEVREYTADTKIEGRQADIYHIDMDHASPTPLNPPPQQPHDIPSTSQVQSPPPQQQSPPPAQPQGGSRFRDYKAENKGEKLERANKVKTMKLRRLRKVETSQRIESSTDTIMKNVSNQGRMIDKSDKDEGAKVVNEEEETKEVRNNAADAQVEGMQADIYHIDMDHAAKVLSMQEEEPEVQEAVEIVKTAKLITKVVAAVSGTVSAAVVPAPVTAATVTPAAVKVKKW
nr:hypothetical protein [Tanacetum cinerariifolium]